MAPLVVLDADDDIAQLDVAHLGLLTAAQAGTRSATAAGNVHDEHAVSNRQVNLVPDHGHVARIDAELGTTYAPILQQLRHHSFRDTHRHREAHAGRTA